jgi:hypothetical protein
MRNRYLYDREADQSMEIVTRVGLVKELPQDRVECRILVWAMKNIRVLLS